MLDRSSVRNNGASCRTGNRLLFVAPSAYVLGGLATWLDYLLPGLQAWGWGVTLGLASGPRHHDPGRYLAAHPFANTVSIHCPCGTAGGRLRAMRKVIRAVDASVILSVNVPDALVAGAYEKRHRHLYTVMTCHGIQQDLFGDMSYLGENLDAIVATNRLAVALAHEISGIPHQRLHHAPYGTSVPAQLPARSPTDAFTIAYSGRLDQPQKRVHDLVGIASRLKEVGFRFRFLVAGTGPEEANLRDRIARANVADEFHLLGFVPSEELEHTVYRAADVLLVPSSWETGPLVIWEAMANGLPVVSSSYIGSGQENLLQDQENCVLFKIGDVDAAAEQIRRIAMNPAFRDQLRQNAFRFAQRHLSHAISVGHWEGVLQKICATPPRVVRKSETPDVQPAGRLDTLLGWRLASSVRGFLGQSPADAGPGGEWAHTLVGNRMAEKDFWSLAHRLDRSCDTA